MLLTVALSGGAAATEDATGLTPAATSWTSPEQGWVLGFEPCETGSCTALLRTDDGGVSWERRTAPSLPEPAPGEWARVLFSDDNEGIATSAGELFATHDGARSWEPMTLAGAPAGATIIDIVADTRFWHAIVNTQSDAAARTQLYSAPLGQNAWNAVPDVAVAGFGGSGHLAFDGNVTRVALGAVYQANGYWTSADGRTWQARTEPCATDAITHLAAPRPDQVYALCSSSPGTGYMVKDLRTSLLDLPFLATGTAPARGFTTGFGAPSSTVMVVAATGGNMAMLHTSFDAGLTWTQPLTLEGPPMAGLAFQDDQHGVVLHGGPGMSDAAVYRTTDGGRSWQKLLQ